MVSMYEKLKEKLSHFGFKAGTGVIYNYGIWKPMKQKFRIIAGTRKVQNPRDNEVSNILPRKVHVGCTESCR